LKTLNIDRLAHFSFPTPLDPETLRAAENVLVELSALDATSKTKKITDLGRRMAAFPVNARYAKMLVVAQQNQGLLPYVIALVAALSVSDVLNSGHVTVHQVEKEKAS
jgi:HrpA-like RNA helicase